MSDALRQGLDKLGTILGVETLPLGVSEESMTPKEFLCRAVTDVAKAAALEAAGKGGEAQAILKLLGENVRTVQKALIFESTGSINLKVQNDATTSDKDKSSKDNAMPAQQSLSSPDGVSTNGVQKSEDTDKEDEPAPEVEADWPLDLNSTSISKGEDVNFGTDPSWS